MNSVLLSTCPSCTAAAPQTQAVCMECGRIHDSPYARGAHRAPRPTGFAFQLDSLLMLTALFGAWLIVAQASMTLAVFTAALAIPALARTYVAARRHREAHRPLGKRQRIAWFLASLGLMMIVYLAWFASFALISMMSLAVGMYFGETTTVVGAILGMNLGLLCATIASVQVARWLWPLGWVEPAAASRAHDNSPEQPRASSGDATRDVPSCSASMPEQRCARSGLPPPHSKPVQNRLA